MSRRRLEWNETSVVGVVHTVASQMTNAGLRTLWRCRSTRSPMATAAWCFALFLGHTTGQDCPKIEPAAAAVDVYPYETLAWYQELKASPARTVTLLQADFANGTYRISEPGRYVLAEDVDFGPLPDNDYWPRENDPAYPQGAWFLGFWAAVTIETDDVWLDLAGHTLRMSSAFHLRQRFFNLVELADRVFDSHEGVASLNLQTNDRLQFGGSAHDLSGSGRTHGAPRHARRCIVSNGVLGLSSHNGLHSNWGSDLVFEDLVIRDFEVAGVQLNGVDRVGMRRVQVGPNLQTMPAYAALSNARFLELYTRRFIPAGFARLGPDHSPQLLALLDEQTISYARAPDARLSLRAVFARLHRALQLWYAREDAEGDAPLPSNADDVALLAQAEARFRNPTGLADGSAVYGIRFHRRGAGTGALGEQDQNYRGPEHFNISMRDCVVSDLRARPLMVPALLTPDGTVVQGPGTPDESSRLPLWYRSESVFRRPLFPAVPHGDRTGCVDCSGASHLTDTMSQADGVMLGPGMRRGAESRASGVLPDRALSSSLHMRSGTSTERTASTLHLSWGYPPIPPQVTPLSHTPLTPPPPTVRDVLDLLRISSHSAASSTSGLMRTLHEARYAGDFLSDAYAALWQLSNAFYTTYVVRSQCGNFGSNLTAAYAPCDTSVVRNDLFGRQVFISPHLLAPCSPRFFFLLLSLSVWPAGVPALVQKYTQQSKAAKSIQRPRPPPPPPFHCYSSSFHLFPPLDLFAGINAAEALLRRSHDDAAGVRVDDRRPLLARGRAGHAGGTRAVQAAAAPGAVHKPAPALSAGKCSEWTGLCPLVRQVLRLALTRAAHPANPPRGALSPSPSVFQGPPNLPCPLLQILCNGDAMFHNLKGVIGIQV